EDARAAIWRKVLNRSQVGIHEIFFELGGHSLLAAQVLTGIREQFHVELPLSAIFAGPTIAELALAVEKLKDQAHGASQAGPRPAAPEQRNLLSFAQHALWFIDQLLPGASTYNIPASVRLRGALDAQVLQQSLTEIVRRHEALRTTFMEEDGAPRQVISASKSQALPITDLGNLPESERENAARALLLTEAQRPFDLSRGPMLRTSLIKLDSQDHILLVTLHHITADGWSLGLFAAELCALYTAIRSQAASPLPELPVQYADYAVWQRERLSGALLANHLAYWKQQLADAPLVLEIPADHSRPPLQTLAGGRRFFDLPPEIAESARQFSRYESATLYMVLLSAFSVFLHSLSGKTDMVIGSPMANRARPETQPLIGSLVNTVALRANLKGDPTFRELVRRIRETVLGADAHQELPFDRLVEALRPARDTSRNPVFQVNFRVQSEPMPPVTLPGIEPSNLEITYAANSKFDLALELAVTPERFGGYFEYSTDLFEQSTIDRFSKELAQVLQAVLSEPDTKLSRLEIRPQPQRSDRPMTQVEPPKMKSLGALRRKAVEITNVSLVKKSTLAPNQKLPLILEPAAENVDLAEWALSHRDELEADLMEHGAVLFRGFGLKTVEDFQKVALGIYGELYGGYGDLPRAAEKIYKSTPYPPDKPILYHNESSHLDSWPMKISFFCVKNAEQGGITPILDCRKVCDLIDPEVFARFRDQGVMYVRNFSEGIDVSWEHFFQTTDKNAVEETCRAAGVELEWTANNNLRTRFVTHAVAKHPKTGETLFFNQIQLHHVSCLDPETRASVRSLFKDEDLPRNVYYGDGSPIEDEVMSHIGEVFERAAVRSAWREGDMIMLDNMLTSHARDPYVGERLITVAMGQMINRDQLPK
ncbi:MAG TPA: condensation domain-containing protein, partial [Chthonomonadales bacterium]|nr:condensation domain-containing protein [Chthonomonadales bacterium]